ncbi:MAG: hypothetical protein JO057_10540 [Chloroflexi bacterium]|nr:hypothetical protein [Chloroflexota bacterium]
MPIPFGDVDDADGLGSAAFLKLERSPDNACCLGALFVMSARGEPLEFGYNRVRVPHAFLWRPADLRRHTDRRLTSSLLSVCSQQPRLLVCLASEVGAELFGLDLRIELSVARVREPVRKVDRETGEVLEDSGDPLHVVWQPAPPEDGSHERRLFEHLATHSLLLEPFERAALGLQEVYGPQPFEPSAQWKTPTSR